MDWRNSFRDFMAVLKIAAPLWMVIVALAVAAALLGIFACR